MGALETNMKQTQKEFVVSKLKKDGSISRNFCLSNYISRLGSIINNLNREGWQLDGENKDGDYIYKVKDSPFRKVVYTLPDGREIITNQLK